MAPPARPARRALAALIPLLGVVLAGVASAQISVITVDLTPFVSPGDSRYGPQNTMGMALELVDPGGLFDVTEVTPDTFRAMSAAELAGFDLIAINNHAGRIFPGIGNTWNAVVGVESGGRVALISHDAPRFHVNVPPGGFGFTNPGPGVEPFGCPDLIRQAAAWAGGVPGRTGLLVFNDSIFPFVPGDGWNNPELGLPPEWGIRNLDPFGGDPLPGGGYTDIVDAFESHPVYAGLSDVRFGVKSINSFGANVIDASFHTVFGEYHAGIFVAAERIVNAGDPNPGDFAEPGDLPPPAPGLDGRAIALLRAEGPAPVRECNDGLDQDGDGLVDLEDPDCLSAVDLSEAPDCTDGLDNDGDGGADSPGDLGCESQSDATERPDCRDGIDNDGDGLADLADPACFARDAGRENPACNDGIDNDGDGLRDFDGGLSQMDGLPVTAPDPACSEAWNVLEAQPRCGLGAELALVLLALARARRRPAAQRAATSSASSQGKPSNAKPPQRPSPAAA